MLVGKLLKSIYVDDVVGGADTEEQAYQFYKRSKQMLAAGSFNLRKFVSNLPSLQAKVEQEEPPNRPTPLLPDSAEPFDETYAGASLPGGTTLQHREHKVLSVLWNVGHDSLFDFQEVATVADELHPTKRNVISVIGRFYDPMGICPLPLFSSRPICRSS